MEGNFFILGVLVDRNGNVGRRRGFIGIEGLVLLFLI